MSVIKAIDSQSVHQICSGQVILDLATAVKELLENALDAGASVVEIKLKEYGISSIEVGDNGHGIEECNFVGLTKKHHTSKLQEFSDLTSVKTFGFRGEALSSLCALSNMTVTTRFKSSQMGHRLEFDHQGDILKISRTARQVGTSILLKNIFRPLPVRHFEFEKNIKREFSKLLTLMYSYCIICIDIQISCVNEVKGTKRQVFRTNGNKSTQDNIVTLFGNKLFKTLECFKQTCPTMECCESYHVNHSSCMDFSKDCAITGYISSCGAGRRTSDMQFISINKRPCHVPKITKLINETFRSFNKNQYPFIQLDISMERDEVDINVTPDKRQVFLTHQKAILAILKSSLLESYNGLNHKVETVSSQPLILSSFKRWDGGKHHDALAFCPIEKRTEISSVKDKTNFSTKNYMDGANFSKKSNNNVPNVNNSEVALYNSQGRTVAENSDTNVIAEDQSNNDHSGNLRSCDLEMLSNKIEQSTKCPIITKSYNSSKPMMYQTSSDDSPLANVQSHMSNQTINICRGVKNTCKTDFKKESRDSKFTYDHEFDSRQDFPRTQRKMLCSLDILKKNWHTKERIRQTYQRNSSDICGLFKAKITSSENDQAEKELCKHFERTNFQHMQIVGQFNLGFIIARHGDDLFIVDQHASDEKYNFEDLLKSTKLNGQPLILPQKLELTASDIMVLEENMEIFIQNGFSFNIRESDIGLKSVYLMKVPSSKNTVFDASDVSELIFMLRDSPHVLCRPTKVRRMFASRACRKSIMIGSSLTHDMMKRIVTHMSDMDQPWNCPHGRPTMRHLIDLSMIVKPK